MNRRGFVFLREARAAARLRHSNVAPVLHLGRTGSSYFYGMEFVQGETLEQLIKRSGRLDDSTNGKDVFLTVLC
jgi:eukaryotic-like serine/threonine-protein kinase